MTLLASHDRQLQRSAELELERLQQALDADAREALAKQLMAVYIASAPGTTEAEASAALPELLHKHGVPSWWSSSARRPVP
jgi:tellurite resistance protein